MVEPTQMVASPAPSDADDRLLFRALDSEVVDLIIRIKHNDPAATRLDADLSGEVDERAAKRLGEIIGQATRLKILNLSAHQGDLVVASLCGELRFNKSIEEFALLRANLRNRTGCLDLFLMCSPSLKELTLINCGLGASALKLLASDLLTPRRRNTLRHLNLSGNNLGDVDLDGLVLALEKSRNLTFLRLDNTGIGQRGCTSLSQLLGNPPSNLQCLCLAGNSIDDVAVGILVDSLAENTSLRELGLGRIDGITAVGWSKVLELVCNSSSIDSVMKSNHTLCNLGRFSPLPCLRMQVSSVLNIDDASLLRASLAANSRWSNRKRATKCKILWSHARGDLNIGESSSIDTGVLPRILGLIGDITLIQYRHPPLPQTRLSTIMLDSTYRIVRARPVDLCSRASAGGGEISLPLTKKQRISRV